MKFVERIAQKFTKQASSTVKTEIKKTAIDLLPTVAGIASMVLGIMIFKSGSEPGETKRLKPAVTNTTITTNNYFFKDISEDMMKKILEEKR